MSRQANPFGAADSALGYLYQCRLALLFLLERSVDCPDLEVSIERLDDVAFEQHGTPHELVQTKHHLKTAANLTDSSPDLWKTVRVWSERLRAKQIELPGVQLLLVTTATAGSGSAAELLRATDRNPSAALRLLRKAARESKSETNKDAYEAFDGLSKEQRAVLIEAITVVDCAPDIQDLRPRLHRELLRAVDRQHVSQLLERLEGWWFGRVIEAMSDPGGGTILVAEVEAQLSDLRHQFRRENLPIDYILAEPSSEAAAEYASRPFVAQLRLIAAHDSNITMAVRDYYRAFEQRSRWMREDLLVVGEIETFERRLIEEWQHQRARVLEDLAVDAPDAQMVQSGRQVYRWAMDASHLRLRRDVEEPYVRRGSFHMLADQRRVGWHPQFLDRLEALLACTVAAV